MTAKDLIEALKAYFIELHTIGAMREAVAIKQFIEKITK
jgi:hypothetical protein